MVHILGITVVKNDGVSMLVPSIDGASLIDLVTSFEQAHSFTPAGSYAGIIPAHFQFGDLTDYYRGIAVRQWPRDGHLWLLGCDCGEVGCWPLEAEVTVADQSVWWFNFSQPHRPAWPYAGFGPFVFNRRQYEDAVAASVTALGG